MEKGEKWKMTKWKRENGKRKQMKNSTIFKRLTWPIVDTKVWIS